MARALLNFHHSQGHKLWPPRRDGYCRIWWDSAGTPWGADWTKVALGLPDHEAADAALSSAIAQGVCR